MVAFEFAVMPGGSSVPIRIEGADLTGQQGSIPASSFRFYRHWPVTVERYPGWYLRSQGLRQHREFPDALVPIDAPGIPQSSARGDAVLLYVEIRIPIATAPGQYRGALNVRGGEGGERSTTVELSIRDVLFSDEYRLWVPARVQIAPIIAANTDLDPSDLRLAWEDADGRRVIERTFSLLQEHGLSPYTDELLPGFSQDQSGAASLDWEVYDQSLGPLIDGSAYPDGRPAFAWPIPVNLTQPDPRQYDGALSTLYAAMLRDYLEKCVAHFEEKGWASRGFVAFDCPATENPSAEELERLRRLIKTTHLASDKLQFLTKLIPQPMRGFGWFDHRYENLSDGVNIWAASARYQDAPTLAQLQALGKRTWLAPDIPPYSGSLAVEAPPVHARSLAWQAFLQGHEAIWLEQVTNCPPTIFEESIRDARQRSDSWLVYPGKYFGLAEPVPSVRLKQLQMGLQEYQYLRLLRAHGRSETARLLAGSLIRACGTAAYGDNFQDGLLDRRTDEADIWDTARTLLTLETEIALHESETPDSEGGVNLAAWAKFIGTTRRVSAWVESARLSVVDPRSGSRGFLATYEVAVRNDLRRALAGMVSFGQMPPEARPAKNDLPVGPIGELELAKRQLIAEFARLPLTNLEGHAYQPIVFEGPQIGPVEMPAVISLAQARHALNSITVDGVLDDWGPGEFNIAGDFRLVGGIGELARRRAESQTVAFFCQDNGFLYIGIRAATPAGASAGAAESNVVRYEELRPVAGDLVEIMIDPTGVGTEPGDLFHIVIKSTGDPAFERGISTSPPIGETGTWPGRRPDYAVSWEENGWTAEIAIPIASLGATDGAHRIWGINLARLEPTRGEYSDWAGAPRYCYDPRSLGNLYWPEE